MAEGSPNIGLLKPPVFSTVNGNTPPYNISHSPVVVPKFKISRGTQANASIQRNISKFSPSPPVPAKPASLCKQPRSPAPPVPPKPGALKSPSPTKPAISPKPALPPKPIMRSCTTGSLTREPVVPPNRPLRSRTEQHLHTDKTEKSIPKYQDRVPVNPVQQLAVKQSRKSASLGRLEGVRCCAMLVNETNERCLQRDSGFISCSLENVGQSPQKFIGQHPHIPVTSLPIAPPRRRRKSADNYEPIYAVIDFSKKRNRRHLLLQDQSNGKNLEQPVEEKTVEVNSSMTMEQSVPEPSCESTTNDGEDSVTDSSALEVSALNATITSSQLDSDIEIIANSLATITSLFEDISHQADSVPAIRSYAAKEPEEFHDDSSSSVEENRLEEQTSEIGQTVIARLVFGGTVVQQTDLLPVSFINYLYCFRSNINVVIDLTGCAFS
jgi:hypothetical protein